MPSSSYATEPTSAEVVTDPEMQLDTRANNAHASDSETSSTVGIQRIPMRLSPGWLPVVLQFVFHLLPTCK